MDSSETIVDAGIGFGNEFFDISAEYIKIDQDIIGGIMDDESYLVAELTVTPVENVSLYADYGKADEADIETVRVGVSWDKESWLNFKLEVSQDDIPVGDDPESVDARATLSF